MTEKIYAPTAKCKQMTGKYGSFLSVSFNVEEFSEWMKANANNRGYVNLNVSNRKEADKYGNTHYMTLDDWEPDAPRPRTATEARPAAPAPPADVSDDDVPF